MDLPSRTSFNEPDEAPAFARQYTVHNAACELPGFFSTPHKGVFTHHDCNTTCI